MHGETVKKSKLGSFYTALRIFSWDPWTTNFSILWIQRSDCHTVPLLSEKWFV